MLFVVFEYKNEKECYAVLRHTAYEAATGAFDVGCISLPIDTLRMAVDSAESFLSLFDAGILSKEDDTMKNGGEIL